MINEGIYNLLNHTKGMYESAYPFPHVVIDNFMSPWILNEVKKEFDTYQNWFADETSGEMIQYQGGKFYSPDIFQGGHESMENLKAQAPWTKAVLDYMNSPELIFFLRELTGMPELMGDNFYHGGGMHRTVRGGKLGIHADFNLHMENPTYRRSLNVLLYLNPEWKEEWGGYLELWDKDLKTCCTKIAPIFNRAVIFNISDDAYHGHPHPLNTPENITRDSLALYYYRQIDHGEEYHPVLWKDIE